MSPLATKHAARAKRRRNRQNRPKRYPKTSTRQAKLNRRAAAIEAGGPRAYIVRNRELASMGYATYADYLASPLWATIRKRVFARSNACEFCGDRATQVHHSSYHRSVLDRSNLTQLHAVCRECHLYGEYGDAGAKMFPAEATQRMRDRTAAERETARLLEAQAASLDEEFRSLAYSP